MKAPARWFFKAIPALLVLLVLGLGTTDGGWVKQKKRAMLRRNADVEQARPDYLTHLAETPNDTYFAMYQYSLRNRGTILDISAAPGVWILSSVPLWYPPEGSLPYRFASGTSQASPHVAGLAALILILKPELKPADVMQIIRYTADDVNKTAHPGRDDFIGYGRINMQRALAPYILR